MAGTGLKLINKLARRTKKIKEHVRGEDRYDQVNLSPKVMQESPRALELMRKAERRMARAMGNFAIARKPVIHTEYVATSVTKSGSDLVITLKTGEDGYNGIGVQVGDWVEVTQHGSQAYGQYLKVTAVTSATVIHVSDTNFAGHAVPWSGTETNVTVRIEINGPKYYY